MMNDQERDAGLERRLEAYYDHAPQPPTKDATWAHLAVHLTVRQADDIAPQAATRQHGAKDIPAETSRQLQYTGASRRRSRVWATAGALVAALLVVALAGTLFAELGRHRAGRPSPAATPKASATPEIRANMPVGTDITAMTMTTPNTGWAVGDVNGAGLILQYSQRSWHIAASGFAGYQ